jgi:4-hydroxy-tetrahydrodipicolinate synthase
LENVVGIKDATGDLHRGRELIERCGGELTIYSGEDGIARELILAGADGTISVTANVVPALMAKMCAAALAGDQNEAERLDAALAMLHRDLFLEANPVPVKWALAQMGLIGPGIRLPLVELNAEFHVQVLQALEAAGIPIPAAS